MLFLIFWDWKKVLLLLLYKSSIYKLSVFTHRPHEVKKGLCLCREHPRQGWKVETHNRWQVNRESLIILILKHSQVILLHSTDWPKCFTKLGNVKKTCQQQRRKYTEVEIKTKAVSNASIEYPLCTSTIHTLCLALCILSYEMVYYC